MRSVPAPVAETAWTLAVNGETVDRGTASPGNARELAIGLSIADGFLTERRHLLGADVRETPHGVVLDVRVEPEPFEAALRERRHRIEEGCGLLHYVACDPEGLRVAPVSDIPVEEDLGGRLRGLFDACRRSHPGGGVHAAAIATADGVVSRSIDVSRHAAVEKAIGASFLSGSGLRGQGLVLTARISGRIAYTAARAGLSWIASRSVPTTLAVAIAAASGQTLIARAGGGEVHRFAPPNRSGAA